MAQARSSDLLRQVRALFGVGVVAGLSDAQLLARFRDRTVAAAEANLAAEAAFEALVARHGPMVLGVCRRALADPADVEDAFQATFLVLVRRAGSIRVDDSLGRWLYGVARRVAAKARVRAEHRRARSVGLAAEPAAPETPDDRAGLLAALDDEVGRLPEKYRAPIVLCHLEGLSHAEAADRLRWPVGTVSGRLSRARGLLKDRLTRRGLAPTVGGIGLTLAGIEVRAAVPESLATATLRAAVRLPAGGGAASASAVGLMNEVLRAAVVIKVKVAAAVLMVLALGGGAAAGIGVGAGRREPAVAARSAPAKPALHRPADEIIKELDAELKIARRPLPHEEFQRVHGSIAALGGELRAAYPADPRVARYMPDRWFSLNYLRRRPEAVSEVAEVLRTSRDPAMRREALFVRTCFDFQEPMDGLAAASLARGYAREAPGDNRVGEILYRAATTLDEGSYAYAAVAVILTLAAALILAASPVRIRRVLNSSIRAAEVVLVVLVVSLVVFQLLTGDRLAEFIKAGYDSVNNAARNQRMLMVASLVLGQAMQQLRLIAAPPRSLVVLALAVMVAVALSIVRRGKSEPGTRWPSPARSGLLGFLGVLALASAVEAGVFAIYGRSLRSRVVREFPDSFRGRLVQGEWNRAGQIGRPLELEFDDAITGRRVSMKDLRGKVVVIDFWATWCGPCLHEIPEMLRIYKRYHDAGVEFIGVSLDGPAEDGGLDDLKKAVNQWAIPWPQYFLGHDHHRFVKGEPTGDFAESWGISGVPTVFLVDAEGRLYSTEARGRLKTLIPRLLKDVRRSATGR